MSKILNLNEYAAKKADRQKMLNNVGVLDLVETKGLECAMLDYSDGEDFENAETKRLWQIASAALSDLVDHLDDLENNLEADD
jgi:uncharacterized protein (DUF362 family)